MTAPKWDAAMLRAVDPALRKVADAHFHCGEWNRDESERPYDEVLAAAHSADDALRDAVAEFVAPLRNAAAQIARDIDDIDRASNEAEYTELDAVWGLLYAIRDRLRREGSNG